MNKVWLSMLFAVGLGLPFFSGLMPEAQAGNVGVIRFVGSIVEDACDVGVDKNHIKTRCDNGGRTATVSRPISQIGTAPVDLPISVGTSQLNWINSKHTLGVLTINYH